MTDDLLERILRRRLFSADDFAERPRSTDDLGKYALVELIGRGGMGEVWKAWSKDLKRHVAIKFVRGHDPEDEARFLREAQIAAGLNHPGIVAIHDVGRHEGRAYLVMPLLQGTTVDRAGLTTAGKVRAVRDAARALDAAHRQGVVHRDVKPSNLMLVDSRPVVMDFGVARLQRVEGAVSRAGAVIGTPQFMSPEQARGDTVDARADVYSLGATLHALLAGAAPFENENVFELLRQVQEEEPRAIRGIDRDLQTIVFQCLQKERERRYATAAELADDLDRYLEREPVVARRAGIAYRVGKKIAKHAKVMAIVAVTVLTVVGVAAAVVVKAGKRVEDEARERRKAAEDKVEAGRGLLTRGDVVAARAAFEAALVSDPACAAAHLELGRLYVREERYELARRSFSAAAELAAARLERAYVMLRGEAVHHAGSGYAGGAAEDVDGAAADLRFVLERSMDAAERRQAEGLLEFVAGRYPEAARHLRDVAGSDARIWEWLGHALYHAVDPTAMEALDRALQLAPGNPDLLQLRAQVRVTAAARLDAEGKGASAVAERRAAMKELDEAVERTPRSSAYFNRAVLRRQAGDLKGCIEDYTSAIQREPTNARAFHNRGTARRASGDVAGAMQDYEEALRLEPRLYEPYVSRANVYLDRKEYDKALADCEKAMEIQPAYANAWNTRGLIRRRQLDLAGAETDFGEAIRRDAKYADAYANRGMVRETLGSDAGAPRERLQEAIRDYTTALDVAPAGWGYRKDVEGWLARAREKLKKRE